MQENLFCENIKFTIDTLSFNLKITLINNLFTKIKILLIKKTNVKLVKVIKKTTKKKIK